MINEPQPEPVVTPGAPPTTTVEERPKRPRRSKKEVVDGMVGKLNAAEGTAGTTAAGTQPVLVKPPAPWTSDGIGQVAVALNNAALVRAGMSELEPEEEKALAEDMAYWLNARWPTGSKYEPDFRLAIRFSGIWIPRWIAKQKREEMERAERKRLEVERGGSQGTTDTPAA